MIFSHVLYQLSYLAVWAMHPEGGVHAKILDYERLAIKDEAPKRVLAAS
jgi:hypothetical protein